MRPIISRTDYRQENAQLSRLCFALESDLRKAHPEWEARRKDGLPQSFLCLSAKGAKEWLLTQISSLVEETNADYLKLDFNVDPGFGCDRADHGHQRGMGLWAHMRNYTALSI